MGAVRYASFYIGFIIFVVVIVAVHILLKRRDREKNERLRDIRDGHLGDNTLDAEDEEEAEGQRRRGFEAKIARIIAMARRLMGGSEFDETTAPRVTNV